MCLQQHQLYFRFSFKWWSFKTRLCARKSQHSTLLINVESIQAIQLDWLIILNLFSGRYHLGINLWQCLYFRPKLHIIQTNVTEILMAWFQTFNLCQDNRTTVETRKWYHNSDVTMTRLPVDHGERPWIALIRQCVWPKLDQAPPTYRIHINVT